MIKKTLIATATVGAVLLTIATILPAIAQSRGATSSSQTLTNGAPANAKLSGNVESADQGAITANTKVDKHERGDSIRDQRHADERREGSAGNKKAKDKSDD